MEIFNFFHFTVRYIIYNWWEWKYAEALKISNESILWTYVHNSCCRERKNKLLSSLKKVKWIISLLMESSVQLGCNRFPLKIAIRKMVSSLCIKLSLATKNFISFCCFYWSITDKKYLISFICTTVIQYLYILQTDYHSKSSYHL